MYEGKESCINCINLMYRFKHVIFAKKKSHRDRNNVPKNIIKTKDGALIFLLVRIPAL